jgi:hypothetical protein
MTDTSSVFAVLTVLFCLYVIAATWRSRGVDPRARHEPGARKVRKAPAERRMVHWR